MKYALSLAALLALAACHPIGSPAARQDAATPAPTGITAGRGGGAQTLGVTNTGNPISTTRVGPAR